MNITRKLIALGLGLGIFVGAAGTASAQEVEADTTRTAVPTIQECTAVYQANSHFGSNRKFNGAAQTDLRVFQPQGFQDGDVILWSLPVGVKDVARCLDLYGQFFALYGHNNGLVGGDPSSVYYPEATRVIDGTSNMYITIPKGFTSRHCGAQIDAGAGEVIVNFEVGGPRYGSRLVSAANWATARECDPPVTTTTQAPTTTSTAPSTTVAPTTTQAPTTTVAPTTTSVPVTSTTVAPTSTTAKVTPTTLTGRCVLNSDGRFRFDGGVNGGQFCGTSVTTAPSSTVASQVLAATASRDQLAHTGSGTTTNMILGGITLVLLGAAVLVGRGRRLT